MNSFGYAFLVIEVPAAILMLLGLILGLRRGLSGELGRILCLVLALWAGWVFHPLLADILNAGEHLSSEATRIAAFGLMTLAAWGALTLVRFLLRHLMEFRFKPPIEQIGGALSGSLRYGLLAALLLYGVLRLFPAAGEKPWVEQSMFAHIVRTTLAPRIEAAVARHPEEQPAVVPADLPDLPPEQHPPEAGEHP